ncbi:unnamed protein product [Nesidiocoris tenuis]|uniref:Integrase catalytic domain-containing protein n=1 Tax=Nesidiocoris tenuis TaxID=355587 RepID=A0A6H5G7S7_9HEMI|nr:unnamed protein product [Nesidiocoris tenuis]
MPQIALPPIKLPTFSGNYNDWLPFYDMFTAIVDANMNIPNIQKLHYLKSSLIGEAASIINSVQLISSNYEVALKLLTDRYHNKNVIVKRHIKDLCDLPKIQQKSQSALHHLWDETMKGVRALKALGQPVEYWDTIIVHLTTSKFDIETFRIWEEKWSGSLATIDDLSAFLDHRCRVLDACSNFALKPTAVSQPFPFKPERRAAKLNTGKGAHAVNSFLVSRDKSGAQTCPECDQLHKLFDCPSFLQISSLDRKNVVLKHRLCLNCFRSECRPNRCKLSGCKICYRKHNTLLHTSESSFPANGGTFGLNSAASPAQKTGAAPSSSQCTSVPSTSTPPRQVNVNTIKKGLYPRVLLSTALVRVCGANNESIIARAAIDNCSEVSMISTHLAERLKLPLSPINQAIIGAFNPVNIIKNFADVKISSLNGTFCTQLRFLVNDQIGGLFPSFEIDLSSIRIPDFIELADPKFYDPAPVDMVIGNEIFWDILLKGRRRLNNSRLHLQETELGWIIGGKLEDTPVQTTVSPLQCNSTTLNDLSQQLQKFWTVENLNEKPQFTGLDKQCEDAYRLTTSRDSSGRYTVQLPLKADPTILGETHSIALKRLLQLEKRLYSNETLKTAYVSFLKEYLSLNHMEEVPSCNITGTHYYIPHHGVLKESSSTTKLRVVYDASCKSSSGVSLNEILMVGPVVQEDLFSILSRFRTHVYALTADVEKMYRQVNVEPSQTNLQLILWRESPNEAVKSYRLKTLTYGTASAAYLATRTLNQLADDESKNFPIAAKVVKRDFYVDDLLTGCSSLDSALKLQEDLIELLKRGGFNLRKWCSNKPELLEHLPVQDLSLDPPSLSQDATIKMLGLVWNPQLDVFKWEINFYPDASTKRSIFSAIARIFDPLGLIGPVIVLAKIFMQNLWSLQLGWDDDIPQPLLRKWQKFGESLAQLNKLQIPRLIYPSQPFTIIELHGFSDASERAYGACVYIRCSDSTPSATVNLIASKSRVTPLKKCSLPRLELCGAVLLAQLASDVQTALKLDSAIFLHTDSTIVLGWIRSPSSHWATFVANRVAKIQECSQIANWHHVPGEENPADLISRGVLAEDILQTDLWWKGPSWLQYRSTSPSNEPCLNLSELPERNAKAVFVACSSFISENELITKYSTLNRLVNVIAYCLRYLQNIRRSKDQRILHPFLLPRERQNALDHLIRIVQLESFPEEVSLLKAKKPLLKSSKLISLNCFLDSNGLLRVGGRLQNASQLTADQRNPIVLPVRSNLTKLIIKNEHKRSLHAGPQLLLAIIRQKYWPINGLTQIKKVLKTCITCFRSTSHIHSQIMGNLPSPRVRPSRAFLCSGVDFCGPFLTRLQRRRGVASSKCYISVFVCFATKAVHLEVVEDLTAEAFIAALRRFIARRGNPAIIYSDNATNFSKAASDLKELHSLMSSREAQAAIGRTLSSEGVEWKFIPAQTPYFGGLWEAAVKSCKYHLRRVVGLSKLTYSELYTVATQVEAFLNSRPITPMSDDPNDLDALTPGHFLIGESLTAPPEQDLRDVNVNRLTRWQLVQNLTQHIWDRWNRDYLSSLQQRAKWRQAQDDLQVGSLVVVREDNLPPLLWRLGRVTDVHRGQDNHVRVATVRTQRGLIKRGIAKLCPLPIDEDHVLEDHSKAGGMLRNENN